MITMSNDIISRKGEPMKDPIERQKAIDVLLKLQRALQFLREPYMALKVTQFALREIEQLPSDQSEIVKCKDCEHLQKWRSEESAKKFGQIYECARGVLACPKPEEDFCSHAERRTDECTN